MILEDSITLLNGVTIKRENGKFPSYENISDKACPCDVCPMNHICSENYWLQCGCEEMFSGLEIEVDKLGRAV